MKAIAWAILLGLFILAMAVEKLDDAGLTFQQQCARAIFFLLCLIGFALSMGFG